MPAISTCVPTGTSARKYDFLDSLISLVHRSNGFDITVAEGDFRPKVGKFEPQELVSVGLATYLLSVSMNKINFSKFVHTGGYSYLV